MPIFYTDSGSFNNLQVSGSSTVSGSLIISGSIEGDVSVFFNDGLVVTGSIIIQSGTMFVPASPNITTPTYTMGFSDTGFLYYDDGVDTEYSSWLLRGNNFIDLNYAMSGLAKIISIGSGVTFGSDIIPYTNNLHNFGSLSKRWNTLFANQVITSTVTVSGSGTTNLINTGSINSYLEVVSKNASAGTNASSDFVANADTATALGNFIDMGINSSGYTATAIVGGPLDAYLYTTSSIGELHIGNASTGATSNIKLFTGGSDSDALTRMFISASGNIIIGNVTSSALNLLTVQGTVSASSYTSSLVNQVGFLGTASNAISASWAPSAPGGISVTVETYTTGANVLWTKPGSANFVKFELWGGGGSGGRGAADAVGGGGGGGAYNEVTTLFSDLVGDVRYTVGAGGAGVTATSTQGNNGGTTSISLANYRSSGVTASFSAFGGGGGGVNAGGGGGGGGGGANQSGSNAGTGQIGGLGGSPNQQTAGAAANTVGIANAGFGGGGGGGGGNATPGRGGDAYYGGGGGGGGSDLAAGTGAAVGGSSVFGGGGGGGANRATLFVSGGNSSFGGSGSAGTFDTTPSATGSIPGGGSGGTEAAATGPGGSGRLRITYW